MDQNNCNFTSCGHTTVINEEVHTLAMVVFQHANFNEQYNDILIAD
jgi:hypothetical protein